MPPRRRTPVAEGHAALVACRAAGWAADRRTTATAVRYTLEELATVAPGRTVEVRVPPHGAVQCIEGVADSRRGGAAVGRPPARPTASSKVAALESVNVGAESMLR